MKALSDYCNIGKEIFYFVIYDLMTNVGPEARPVENHRCSAQVKYCSVSASLAHRLEIARPVHVQPPPPPKSRVFTLYSHIPHHTTLTPPPPPAPPPTPPPPKPSPKAERRRTSSPWRGFLRWARGWWGGRRRCARRSTPWGPPPPLIPAGDDDNTCRGGNLGVTRDTTLCI